MLLGLDQLAKTRRCSLRIPTWRFPFFVLVFLRPSSFPFPPFFLSFFLSLFSLLSSILVSWQKAKAKTKGPSSSLRSSPRPGLLVRLRSSTSLLFRLFFFFFFFKSFSLNYISFFLTGGEKQNRKGNGLITSSLPLPGTVSLVSTPPASRCESSVQLLNLTCF